MTSKDKKQVAIYVKNDFPAGGAELKLAFDDFFQFLWDNTNVFEKYEKAVPTKAKRLKELLEAW